MYNITDDGFHAEEGFNPIRKTTTAAATATAATATGDASQSTNMTPLPANFEPGPDDVICGRGKKCYNHVGNERFRLRVLTYLEEYSAAKSKLEKSGVLSKVVDAVRQQSPDGGFVKQDDKGNWHEVGDFLAREKTSQSFRDALHDRYKSSNISKKKRRQDEQNRQEPSRAMMMQEPRSDFEMSSRLERLSNELLNSRTFILFASGAMYEFMQQFQETNLLSFSVTSFRIDFPETLHEIDFYSRRNSDVIAAQQAYDLQIQAQLPQRVHQQSGVAQYLGSSRRYSSGSMDFYSPSRERPINEMARMNEMARLNEIARLPDPLFGTTTHSTMNATPSDFDRERLSVAQREFERDRSVANTEIDYNRSEHIAYGPLDAKSFHLSYPELMQQNIFEDYSLHQQSSIHQTFPDSEFAKHVRSEGDRKRPAKDIDPAQYESDNFPARRLRKPVPEAFVKKVATDPYLATAAAAPTPTTAHFNIQQPLSHHPPGTRMVGGQRISRDLMDCLDKMTYHSVADDNPFEPIPLAPHQEAALSVNRRLSDVAPDAVDSYHRPSQQQPQQHNSIDESERDEFAEG